MDKRLFTTADAVLLATLLVLGCLVPRLAAAKSSGSSAVEISCDGEVLASYSLEKDRILLVQTQGEKASLSEISEESYEHIISEDCDNAFSDFNIIIIEDGSVSVSDADCKGKDCVKTGSKSRQGSVIACLPHRLLITIASEEEPESDVVVY